MHADWSIISVDGVSAESGITTYHAEEAAINRLMLERSTNRLIATVSAKIGRVGFMKVCELAPRIKIVTNEHTGGEAYEALKRADITVV